MGEEREPVSRLAPEHQDEQGGVQARLHEEERSVSQGEGGEEPSHAPGDKRGEEILVEIEEKKIRGGHGDGQALQAEDQEEEHPQKHGDRRGKQEGDGEPKPRADHRQSREHAQREGGALVGEVETFAQLEKGGCQERVQKHVPQQEEQGFPGGLRFPLHDSLSTLGGGMPRGRSRGHPRKRLPACASARRAGAGFRRGCHEGRARAREVAWAAPVGRATRSSPGPPRRPGSAEAPGDPGELKTSACMAPLPGGQGELPVRPGPGSVGELGEQGGPGFLRECPALADAGAGERQLHPLREERRRRGCA